MAAKIDCSVDHDAIVVADREDGAALVACAIIDADDVGDVDAGLESCEAAEIVAVQVGRDIVRAFCPSEDRAVLVEGEALQTAFRPAVEA